nr:NTF2-like domain-containing protein [Tanacetum cinerariifolium]
MSIGNQDLASDPTPSDTIHQFYKCMNEKNVKQLENYISNDCFFEDYSFPKAFKGKKEVICFLDQLITGMGKNIEFHVGHIYEGDDDLVAAVNWHLEWKDKQVPFTRGCSLYRLTRDGERLVIRNAQVFVESPIKPGDLFLLLEKHQIMKSQSSTESAFTNRNTLEGVDFESRRKTQHYPRRTSASEERTKIRMMQSVSIGKWLTDSQDHL